MGGGRLKIGGGRETGDGLKKMNCGEKIRNWRKEGRNTARQRYFNANKA